MEVSGTWGSTDHIDDVEPIEHIHAAILTQPAHQPRRVRRAQQRAVRRAATEAAAVSRANFNAQRDQARQDAADTTFLPAADGTGPATLRTTGRFRVPAHQDTTATLASAYPFLAEGGLGSEGVFVGQDMFGGSSFVYDPWVLYRNGVITAPNIVLAGIVGSGKLSLATSLYTRSMSFGRRVYVPGDAKGEHTPVAEAVGGVAIRLGHGLPPPGSTPSTGVPARPPVRCGVGNPGRIASS